VTRSTFLDAALAAAGRGWRVFPLCPGRKQPRRAAADWETRATTDPARIARWWSQHPRDNVAIATGPSGLVVVDLDVAKRGEAPPPELPDARGGWDVLVALGLRHGQAFERTFSVATPSGGRHLYYRAPKGGGPWRNTAGRLGWHIDTRAHGGYVVAAGSRVDGRRYRVVDEAAPVELPAWLAALLAPPEPEPAPAEIAVRPARRRRGYARAALAGEIQRVLDAPEGQRNAALNRAAWNLGRLIARGVLPRALVEDTLCRAGTAAGGQSAAGVAATVRSALDARLQEAGR
jgi:GNAT superfamily N-acetyltransferase